MSNYTEANVTKAGVTLQRVLDNPKFGPELRLLVAAALEGVKVPGLVEQVDRLHKDWGNAVAREAAWHVASGLGDDATPSDLETVLRKRDAEVSSLQARVAELTRERNEARRWEETHRKASQGWEDMFNATQAERDALRAQVAEANRKRDWMAEEHTRMRQERNAAVAATALVKADREGVWFWEKGGENGLESLTCPVVMEAETLRELLSAPPAETTPAPERESGPLKHCASDNDGHCTDSRCPQRVKRESYCALARADEAERDE